MTVMIDRERDATLNAGGNTESRVARTALTVLERVRADLVGTPFRVIVTDKYGRPIEPRREPVSLPAEVRDAVGRALSATRAFMESRGTTTVAVTPVSDPSCGRPVAVVVLMCRAETASELMMSYVRRVGRDIEEGLLDDALAAERVLIEHFVRARRHARGAIVSLNERTMIVNAAASRFVVDADRPALWDWAQGAIARDETKVQQVSFASGMTATACCEPVVAAGVTLGVLVRLDAGERVSAAEHRMSGKKRPPPATIGWASLSAAQLGIAELVAGGLTNKEIAARVFLSPHTVDFHLRQIFAKLRIESRVELARVVSEHSTDQREAS